MTLDEFMDFVSAPYGGKGADCQFVSPDAAAEFFSELNELCNRHRVVFHPEYSDGISLRPLPDDFVVTYEGDVSKKSGQVFGVKARLGDEDWF